MNAGESTTMIGKSVRITGDLSGSEDLVMDGELQGTIRLPGARLTIGPSARVLGNVAGADIVVFGRLEGDIRATGSVQLRASAVVQGNIYAASFSIEENAAFRGQIDPSRSQEPMPESSATAPTLVSRPSTPTEDSSYRAGRQLPAALAAVAARSAAVDSSGGDREQNNESAPLFVQTEA